MATNSNPQKAPALALAALLAEHPDVIGFTWFIDPAGVLHGQLIGAAGHGEIVDTCAQVIGGTAVHSLLSRGTDRQGLAQVATLWHGVPVEVWASYSLPEPKLPLGVVAVLPPAALPAVRGAR